MLRNKSRKNCALIVLVLEGLDRFVGPNGKRDAMSCRDSTRSGFVVAVRKRHRCTRTYARSMSRDYMATRHYSSVYTRYIAKGNRRVAALDKRDPNSVYPRKDTKVARGRISRGRSNDGSIQIPVAALPSQAPHGSFRYGFYQ